MSAFLNSLHVEGTEREIIYHIGSLSVQRKAKSLDIDINKASRLLLLKELGRLYNLPTPKTAEQPDLFSHVEISIDEVAHGFDIRGNYFGPSISMVRDVAEFYRKFEMEYDGKPRLMPADMAMFREDFLAEEVREYCEATAATRLFTALGKYDKATESLAKAFDALIDLVYVALGNAHLHGFPFEKGWPRIQEANMKKVRASSVDESRESSGRGSVHDVIKPKGWEPPTLLDLVANNIYTS
jgi:predicted HAD superfamily Cof-like phosphohydrolase